MELVENRKKNTPHSMKKLVFVFCILTIFIFPISILLILPHSEKFIFIILDFPSHLFFILIFSPLLSIAIRRKRIQGKGSGDDPVSPSPGTPAPCETALLIFHLPGQRAQGGSTHEPWAESRASFMRQVTGGDSI